MYKRWFLLISALCIFSFVNAQYSVAGRATDAESGQPLRGSTISLQSVTDSAITFSTTTDSLGIFRFEVPGADSFRITISSIGYETLIRSFRIHAEDIDLGSYALPRSSGELSGVTVTASTPAAVQRGDTVQFSASQYKVNPDATAEDLARKIPGITVENGQVKAGGENVQKVTIDGRELFGDDATAALRNLPAEVIDKIQVFDRLSEQAQLTGFDDGNTTKGINIITKANMRNGQFGRVFGGYGTNNRYHAGGNATMFKENRRISIVGNFNNVNQQNFSQQDLLGVTSSQRGGGRGRPGGGRGGPGGGGFGRSDNFQVGQQPGINTTNSFGVNFADTWGSKLTVTGSYFFNNTDNNTNETGNIQYLSGSRLSSRDSTVAGSRNNNHRVNMRLEYTIDSSNRLIFIPSFRFQDNNSDRMVLANTLFNPESQAKLRETRSSNITGSDRNARNYDNRLLYRHSFPKRGRTLGIDVETSFDDRDSRSYVTAFQQNTDEMGAVSDTTTQRLTRQVSDEYEVEVDFDYSEPLGEQSQLQLSYEPSISKSRSDQKVHAFDPSGNAYSIFLDSLSNQFVNTRKSQDAGLSYRWGQRDRQISFGLNYRYTLLESEQELPRSLQIRKSFTNFLPNARIQYKISPQNSLNIRYRARVNAPSVTQLQGVIDPTHAPNYSIGNPDLNQQYSNTLSSQFTHTNTRKGILFMVNVFWQTASDHIANATFVPQQDTLVGGITLPRGSQLRKPVNLDGYSNLRSFFTFAIPMKFIKSNLNLNGGVGLNRQPGVFENQATMTDNYSYSLGSVISSNVSQYVDFTLSYNGSLNTVRSTQEKTGDDNRYYFHSAGLQMNLLSKKGWFFQNDVNNQFYSGLSDGMDEQYFLWNMAVGKKFLPGQKGELKLGVFDLLKQNRSIVRNVTDTEIEDVQNEVLQQYFMLTFTYNLRNFGPAEKDR